MKYRQLPHGNEKEKYGVLGLRLGGIGTTLQAKSNPLSARPLTRASTFGICPRCWLKGLPDTRNLLSFCK